MLRETWIVAGSLLGTRICPALALPLKADLWLRISHLCEFDISSIRLVNFIDESLKGRLLRCDFEAEGNL